MNDILQVGNSKLNQRSVEVDHPNHVKKLSVKLKSLTVGKLAYGVAAPQIGILKRVFAWNSSGLSVVINPVILESDGLSVEKEGCLSIPGIACPVERASSIHVEFMDHSGEIVQREFDGLKARVFQHELDHLDGVLMFDRMPEEERKELYLSFGVRV